MVFSWDQYKNDLTAIFRIRDGGLAIYGGVIGGLLVAWLYTKKKKIPFLHLADFGIPYLVFRSGGRSLGQLHKSGVLRYDN